MVPTFKSKSKLFNCGFRRLGLYPLTIKALADVIGISAFVLMSKIASAVMVMKVVVLEVARFGRDLIWFASTLVSWNAMIGP